MKNKIFQNLSSKKEIVLVLIELYMYYISMLFIDLQFCHQKNLHLIIKNYIINDPSYINFIFNLY